MTGRAYVEVPVTDVEPTYSISSTPTGPVAVVRATPAVRLEFRGRPGLAELAAVARAADMALAAAQAAWDAKQARDSADRDGLAGGWGAPPLELVPATDGDGNYSPELLAALRGTGPPPPGVLVDPDCQAGKHQPVCVGGPCQCGCHEPVHAIPAFLDGTVRMAACRDCGVLLAPGTVHVCESAEDRAQHDAAESLRRAGANAADLAALGAPPREDTP